MLSLPRDYVANSTPQQRDLLGDPAFCSRARDVVNHMLTDNFSGEVREAIRLVITDITPLTPYNPPVTWPITSSGTTHVVVTDKDGMSISLTTTINHLFGSKILDPTSGVLLNNQMNDFTYPSDPDHKNTTCNNVEPKKRPLSGAAPVIITERKNNRTVLVAGGNGGSRIPALMVQIIMNLLDLNLNITEAVSLPRIMPVSQPNLYLVESGMDGKVMLFLKEKGQDLVCETSHTGVQALWTNWDGVLFAQGEPRLNEAGGVVVYPEPEERQVVG